MAVKCFYHNADLDGICSAAIVRRKYPDCELHGINYGDDFPWDDIHDGNHIIMVDFSLQPFDEMLRLCIMKPEQRPVTWIDHHKSAIEEYEKYLGGSPNAFKIPGVRTSKLAACEIAWMYFFEDEVTPDAVTLLGRYDVWDHGDPRVLPFQYAMRSMDYGPDHKAWNEVWLNTNTVGLQPTVDQFVQDGGAILRYVESSNRVSARKLAYENTFIDGLRAVEANKLCNSKFFESVYDSEKHDIMVSYYYDGKQWTVSMFSTKNDVDCSEIAKRFGGGGHHGAAGFQCDELPFAAVHHDI